LLKEILQKTQLLKKTNTLPSNYKKKIEIVREILKREPFLFEKIKIFFLKYKKPKIDLIGVTVGPGLEPCLWQGINLAKALSYFWEIPIVKIHHIEAHILANFLNIDLKTLNNKTKIFPALALVVSGGHTQLILMKKFGQYKILGETRDDAAGEAFDKIARILGLGYPGGPSIAKMAEQANKKIKNLSLPRPMIYARNYDFSFSGLKTAVLYDYKNRTQKIRESQEYIKSMAKEAQQAIVEVLIKKTIRAAEEFGTKSILLGGGVSANQELRKQLRKKIQEKNLKLKLLMPSPELCTDNAQMVALAAFLRKKEATRKWQQIKAEANLGIEKI